MSLILDITFGLLAVVVLGFWVLFLLVVKPRIAERVLSVPDTSGLGFLLARWPHPEVQAYVADLTSEERRRLVNLFIARAHLAAVVLAGAFGLTLAMQVGSTG